MIVIIALVWDSSTDHRTKRAVPLCRDITQVPFRYTRTTIDTVVHQFPNELSSVDLLSGNSNQLRVTELPVRPSKTVEYGVPLSDSVVFTCQLHSLEPTKHHDKICSWRLIVKNTHHENLYILTEQSSLADARSDFLAIPPSSCAGDGRHRRALTVLQ